MPINFMFSFKIKCITKCIFIAFYKWGKYLDQLCESGSYGACAAWIFRLAFLLQDECQNSKFQQKQWKVLSYASDCLF